MITTHDLCIQNMETSACRDLACVCLTCAHRINEKVIGMYTYYGYCGTQEIVPDYCNRPTCRNHVDWIEFITTKGDS